MISSNVSLRLTRNPKILAVLRERDMLDADGKLHLQFDAQDLAFGADNVVTVPENVAQCLMDRRPLMGGTPRKREVDGETVTYLSAYDAQFVPILEVVEKWRAGEQPPSVKASAPTTCGTCGVDQGSIESLIKHLGTHVRTAPALAGAEK